MMRGERSGLSSSQSGIGASGEGSRSSFRERLRTTVVSDIPYVTPPPTEVLGYLHQCIDRRYVSPSQAAFSEASGLDPRHFWQGGTAGGAAMLRGSLEALSVKNHGGDIVTKGIEHARNSGAIVWGWQAHGTGCGGLPGESDGEIEARLYETARVAREVLPGNHLMVFATEKRIVVRRVF